MKTHRCLLLLPVVLCGCIRHEATVRTTGPGQAAARGTVNGRPVPALGPVQSRSGGLPRVTLVHGWYRASDGSLVFLDAEARSPLAWWQRFPADLFTDLAWPGTINSRSVPPLRERRPPDRDPATIDRIAAAAGYGGRPQSATTLDGMH